MKRVSYSGLCSGLAASYHPVIALNPGSARERKVGHLFALLSFSVIVPSKSVKKMILGFASKVCGKGIVAVFAVTATGIVTSCRSFEAGDRPQHVRPWRNIKQKNSVDGYMR